MLVSIVVMSGCGRTIAAMSGIQIINPNDFVAVSANTTDKHDRHVGIRRITGPTIYAQNNLLGHTYFLRAWGKPSKDNFKVQLYISARLKNWAFLNRAYSHGRNLDLIEISRDVVSCSGYGCSLREDVAINFSIKEVREIAQRTTYELKIIGQRGSIEISAPGNYFRGFLIALESPWLLNRPTRQ